MKSRSPVRNVGTQTSSAFCRFVPREPVKIRVVPAARGRQVSAERDPNAAGCCDLGDGIVILRFWNQANAFSRGGKDELGTACSNRCRGHLGHPESLDSSQARHPHLNVCFMRDRRSRPEGTGQPFKAVSHRSKTRGHDRSPK